MSKISRSVQQVYENTQFARISVRNIAGVGRRLPHFLALLACILSFAGCKQHEIHPGDDAKPTPYSPTSTQRILRRGLPGEPQTLDPQLADDTYSFQVIRDLYEGLTSENRDGLIVPGAAKSWTVDSAGTTYTFELRQDAKWSDGSRTEANEFVAGLRRAVDPKTASGSADLLSVIKGATDVIAGRKPVTELRVAALGPTSIRIELEHPAPYLLQILAQPIAAPMHLRSIGSANHQADASNGPYKLVRRVPGSFIELSRNESYWDAARVVIERVRYLNVESGTTELHEFAADQLDMTFTIPMSDYPRISAEYGIEVQNAPVLTTQYLDFNLSEPILRDNKDLRQALSMAVDRDEIAAHVMAGVTPAYSLVARGISNYHTPTYEWKSWSRERQLGLARELYAKAGFSDKRPLRLKLYFNRDEGIQRVMAAIAGSWKQNLGVDSQLVSDEFRVFLTGRRDKLRWDLVRVGWNADYDDPSSFLQVFTRNNIENDAGYESREFNELIDAAKQEPNNRQRIALLEQSEQVLLNDYPLIPIYFYTARRLVKARVGGAEITPMNHSYTKFLFWK
jgi:oligopeptide transport system substrate-binding protein